MPDNIDIDKLSDEVLTLIEIREAQLLSWGFISGSMDLPQEIPALMSDLPSKAQDLWQAAQKQGITTDDLLDNLVKRKLVLRLAGDNYRSRFAETIRLTYLLRQRFSEKDWFTAKKLVSDLKLHLRRRRYPQWDIPLAELEAALETVNVSKLQLETVKQLLQADDKTYLSLAYFQKEAVIKQFANLQAGEDRAIVIGAGTGAGKTKAFYIPALAHIAEHIDPNQSYLQVLALYPRIELLKDQLAEAFSEARKLDGMLRAHGKRPISLGAYYGNTPESAARLQQDPKRYGWRKSAEGYSCPFFNCPVDANHEIRWEITDVKQEVKANKQGHYGKHARLRCRDCTFTTEPNELLLTRRQLRRQPPDILFTTTEMLNRRMSRAKEHALFGIGQAKAPRLMLLDEIHTYEGVSGAQVAYLLRRWQHIRDQRRGQNLCIVGLSATLTQATTFFATLTGISAHHVDYIHPPVEKLTEEGIEYNVVVKGDPVAGTALLSTSVQTGMLLGRVLDPVGNPISAGAYGQRIFAFTDKLDVINRWYHIMYDAESKKRLSRHRRQEGPGPLDKRRAQGQVWTLPQRLGYDLEQPLTISRTSSQDPGVSQNTDLIIATSTLEVGFNDTRVGGVIQHKAPRSMASFLQRKGRAGRTRGMRPWMVVVTSAYGRDRWAFQHAETLFDPLLPPMDLPIKNYYVRKIQAAFALMDWATQELKAVDKRVNVWRLLSSGPYQRSKSLDRPRQRLRNLLLRVLEGQARDSLEQHLTQALGLEEEELHRILWGEPRPLYLEVIPTILRQLETNWRQVAKEGSDLWADAPSRQPLPQFVPSALFSDLNIPEVQILLPQDKKKETDDSDDGPQETMALAQSIREFAPGKANKRLVQAYRTDIAHWIPLPDDAQLSRNRLNLQLLTIDFLEGPRSLTVNETPYHVYRPQTYRLENVPTNVRSTSSAQLLWRSHFKPQQYGRDVRNREQQPVPSLQLSAYSSWQRFLDDIQVYSHANGDWVNVSRLAIGVKTDTRYYGGGSRNQTLYFEDKAGDAAIGFTVAADALCFTIDPLNVHALRELPDWPHLYHHLGPEFFRHKLHHDQRLLEAGLSTFAIDWLWQLELSMLTAVAVARQCPLVTAAEEVESKRVALADRTLQAIFQSQRMEDEDEEQQGRLHRQLLDYMEEESIIAALREGAQVLWTQDDPALDRWLEEVYSSSLGATLLTAIIRLVPEIEPDDLCLDVDDRLVWISETTDGGVGLIAKIADKLAQHPRDFELLLYDTIYYCEREYLAHQLRAVTKLLAQDNEDLQNAFARVRRQNDLPSLMQTKQQLSTTLAAAGIPATRQLLVALNTKFLRPNSADDSDQLVVTLIDHWEAEEKRLGAAIDLRVMAVAARHIDEVEDQLQQVLARIGGNQPFADESQIFNLLQSLLWLTCHDSCPDCIETWQPYQQLAKPSRALLQSLLKPEQVPIVYGSPYWEEKTEKALASEYQAEIDCPQAEIDACKKALAHFLTTPVDIGYQRFFPVVERLRQRDQQWYIQMAIRELLGG